MIDQTRKLLTGAAENTVNGWSIGSFGAIGEFIRDADEPSTIVEDGSSFAIVTARGGMRIAPAQDLRPIAWDSLSADGDSWSHSLAFCVKQPARSNRVIQSLGTDRDALRGVDCDHALFDLGVGCGSVRMCLRTDDIVLMNALHARAGFPLLGEPALMGEVLRAQPHRVLLSPAGRIEVFQPIPPPDGKSPVGPHTHLLRKLIAKDRPHSANVPIPKGWQSALTLHPPSPWRGPAGDKLPFNAVIDAAFLPILSAYGLPEDAEVEARVLNAIGGEPCTELENWPETRRGRIKARIVLRRLAAVGDGRVASWRALFDRSPAGIEDDETHSALQVSLPYQHG
jgi:hypothetical protein